MSWRLNSFFKNLGFCQGNTFRNLLGRRVKKGPVSVSVISIQKGKYALLYSKQLKFRNVTVMYDIHTIKIHEDCTMQKIIHNLALHSHKHWCLEITKWLRRELLSESSEESLKNHFMLAWFFFFSKTGNSLHLPNSGKNVMDNSVCSPS